MSLSLRRSLSLLAALTNRRELRLQIKHFIHVRPPLTIFSVFARLLKRTRQRAPLFALWAHLQVPRKVHVGIEPIHRRHEHEQPLTAAENAHINHANVPQRVEYLWPHARMQRIIRRRRVPVHANGLRPRANHLNRHAR